MFGVDNDGRYMKVIYQQGKQAEIFDQFCMLNRWIWGKFFYYRQSFINFGGHYFAKSSCYPMVTSNMGVKKFQTGQVCQAGGMVVVIAGSPQFGILWQFCRTGAEDFSTPSPLQLRMEQVFERVYPWDKQRIRFKQPESHNTSGIYSAI